METITTTLELDTQHGEIAEVVIYAEYEPQAQASRDAYGRATECDTAEELFIVCLEIEGADYVFEEAYAKFFAHESKEYIQRKIAEAVMEQDEFNQENNFINKLL